MLLLFRSHFAPLLLARYPSSVLCIRIRYYNINNNNNIRCACAIFTLWNLLFSRNTIDRCSPWCVRFFVCPVVVDETTHATVRHWSATSGFPIIFIGVSYIITNISNSNGCESEPIQTRLADYVILYFYTRAIMKPTTTVCSLRNVFPPCFFFHFFTVLHFLHLLPIIIFIVVRFSFFVLWMFGVCRFYIWWRVRDSDDRGESSFYEKTKYLNFK